MAGMTVQTKGAIWGDGLRLASVPTDGTLVEIGGYMINDTTIQATYIELEDDHYAHVEMEGMVTALTDNTFKLNGVTGRYDKNQFSFLPLQNGMMVEVEGTFGADGSLTAIVIERDGFDFDFDDAAAMELEGIVTWISPLKDSLQLNRQHKVTLTPLLVTKMVLLNRINYLACARD